MTRLLLVVVSLLLVSPISAQIPAPQSVLGFVPGTDKKLVPWPKLVEYYQALGAASDRITYREIGRTTLDAPFVALVITSPENMAQLEEIRAANLKLADPRLIASIDERERLLRDGKTIVLVTSSIHSTEVGTHLAPTLIAHRLATDTSLATRQILENTVVLLVPSLNPDGITIVADWYNRTVDTKAEGTGPPELYHHYVGHDNNRDWYAFTQVETQLTIDSLHNAWHPQIVHDIHQQGASGSRFFLPPFLDPVEPNVDPLIVQGFNTLGTFMAWELAGQGKQGIVVDATYDAWTPARAYQHHHAGVRVLSETASANLASPIDIDWEELRPGRNFDARVSSVNFSDPWPGGRWSLSNIVDYQTSGAFALLHHAANHRSQWISNFLKIGERAVRGWDEWPYAFAIRADQTNQIGLDGMLEILHRGQVEIRTARSAFAANGQEFPAGTYVIELRQPYASFAKALLEVQDYPDLRQYPGGPPRPPYDVTAHTLPLLMGVDVTTIQERVDIALSANIDRPEPAYWHDGASRNPNTNVPARTALYKSYTASMDEGWTRWIFDTWRIPYVSAHDDEIRAGGLADAYDVVIIPDIGPRAIVEGLSGERYPDEFAGGLGADGVAALRAFVEAGGTLITFNDASTFAIETFDLPVRNAVGGMTSQEFFAPGTLVGLELETTHPLATHVPQGTAAWFQRGPAWDVTENTGLKVIARYASHPDSVLRSGWILHPERIAGKAALIEATVGAGKVVLFGFRPQYRGQSIATYPLFLNALRKP